MKSITELPTLAGKRVLIRVDYNVPLKGNRIIDARRIESSYKTIDTILKKGGTPILLAHLGDGAESLKPVARYLGKRYKVLFISETLDVAATNQALEQIQKKTVVLFENLRRDPGEEKNTATFAKRLASYGSYYVNDAFSVSHRAHASVVGIPRYLPAYAGFQIQEEIKALSSVYSNPSHPFLFILGGAKFATKIPLLDRFSAIADHMVIAGAILNTFYKAAGFEIGASVAENGYDAPIKKLLKNPKLLLPTDVLVRRGAKNVTVSPEEIEAGDKVVDIGKESITHIAQKIAKAKLVVWNGPTGWYEGGYTKGTLELAKALVQSRTKAVIGGGDTAAVLEKLFAGKKQKRIFISTGGGAALEYLSKGTLPGITALEAK